MSLTKAFIISALVLVVNAVLISALTTNKLLVFVEAFLVGLALGWFVVGPALINRGSR